MTPNVDPITFFNKANELMVKNSPAAADKEMLEKIAVVNIGPGMEFDTSVLTGDVAENWKTMLTEIRLKLIKEGQKFSKSLVSGTILVNRSEISIQNMFNRDCSIKCELNISTFIQKGKIIYEK